MAIRPRDAGGRGTDDCYRDEGAAGVEFASLWSWFCLAGAALELGMGFYRKMQILMQRKPAPNM